jgi:multiple sugar transport system permease protein
VIITVISVILELVLGMLIAQAMYRAIFARTAIRASVLVPYGAVTVVAAFAWRLAFDPATGFVVSMFNLDTPPLTTRSGSFFVIILAEVWKTTPFMALLLLAGLALVPEELMRAAKVDGANAFQRFDPETERFTTFELPSPGANVRQLLGRTGELWGAESGVDKLVVLRTA